MSIAESSPGHLAAWPLLFEPELELEEPPEDEPPEEEPPEDELAPLSRGGLAGPLSLRPVFASLDASATGNGLLLSSSPSSVPAVAQA